MESLSVKINDKVVPVFTALIKILRADSSLPCDLSCSPWASQQSPCLLPTDWQ